MYDISQISKPQRFVERVEKATYTEGATGGWGGEGPCIEKSKKG
jgi:hypothetical protein